MNVSSALSELKDPWDQRLVALGDDAKAIESSMHAAQLIVRQYAARLNALNRVVSLPAEILERVFLALQRVEPTSTGPVHHEWSAESEWVLITHVCHRWRQVAMSYCRLWTDVDVDAYGVTLCKEMLSRLGCQPFALSATVKAHEGFLFTTELRSRIPAQLKRLTLNYDDTVTHPGAFLDTILSQTSSQPSSVLKELKMACKNPQSVFWASLECILPGLTSLSLTYLHLHGSTPSSFPMLTDLTFNWVDLTFGWSEIPGILDLISVLPLLESARFTNCSFSPLDADRVTLPSSIKLVHFEAYNEWSLQQCRALSRMLIQTTGDRVFMMGPATSNIAEEIFEEVTDTDNWGLKVQEITVEVTGWYAADASVRFQSDASSKEMSFCIEFRHMPPACWSPFCTSVKNIDASDARLRLICDRGTPYTYTQNVDMVQELRDLTVSSIYLTGRMSSYLAIGLFTTLRRPPGEDWPSLAFFHLRDVCIEHSPVAATVEIPSLNLIPVESLAAQLDEAALYLLWYARLRRDQCFGLLRSVALPEDLLEKHWVKEVDELLQDGVVSYDAFIKADHEMETTDCRAVVLYRPILRALRFWDTWIFTLAPVIGTLGILWTSSRRR
ncbi:hypothetical protein PENSPDRAFT_752221 [Peniophora sp. CONT]|nr:hypothetical protein PENSPDRAFT_752221 [Peniophora sp. CONT]